MPLLISILSVSAGGQFIDDSGGLFISDAEGVFEDSEGILRLSTENFTGNRYWSGDVVNIDPIAWRMDNIYGGACRLSGAGNIQITLKALDSADWWFQDMKYPCRIEYTDALEDSAILLIDCTLHLKNIDLPLSATFDVFPESYDSKLLETVVNYDGETVVLPKAFGTVTHCKPVRLADLTTPCYTWVQKADFGGIGLSGAIAAAVGAKIYIGIGGGNSDWWAYDTISGLWTQKNTFPGSKRTIAIAAAVGAKIYTGTGYDGANTQDWYAYDTATDTWTTKLSFPGAIRSGAVAAAVGAKIYAGLGLGAATYKDWYAYDTTNNTWSAALAVFPNTERYGAVAAAVGAKIYAGLGLEFPNSFKQDWYAYDTTNNTWSAALAVFPGVGRYFAASVVVGTKIYVGTGQNASDVLADWYAYDTIANTWATVASMVGSARVSAVAASVGDILYVGTGANSSTYLMRDWWGQDSTAMYQQYSAGGLLACSVYDDGVDVTSNASAISGNVFTYNVQPVGELTISGTSPYIYTHTIFPYLCGASFLNLGCNMAFAGTSQIDRWVTEQINVIDFLSNIAAAETIYFWVQSGVLNVRSFTAGYSPAVVVDVADDTLEGTDYFYSQPISIFRSKWKQRVAVEESIGKYVKETDQEETATTVYPYGSEIEIDTFTETRTTATARLVAIMARYNLTQTSLTMPLQNITTKPGDALTLSDDRFTGREIVAKAGIIRDVVFDIINKKWTIEADGNFFS